MNTPQRMKIETGSRKVKQTFRRFTPEQRREIIRSIDNRPPNVTKTEMFEKYGMSKTGGLYYHWKKKGWGGEPMNRKMTSVMNEGVNVPTNTVRIQQIVVEVDITSVDLLFNTLKEINKIKGVKSVSV